MKDVRLDRLATNLSILRQDMKLSREAMAEIVGSSASHISKLEHARTADPGWFVIENLARFFGVSGFALMNDDLSKLDQRQQALQRIRSNFNETEWESLIDLIDGTTRRQAKNGQFRLR